MQDTAVDENALANLHVQPDGYISQAWARVLIAIQNGEDFDYRKYLQELIDQVIEALPPDKNRLN